LNNEDWLKLWARRYGESAVQALADELRARRGAKGATDSKEATMATEPYDKQITFK
jgi:hypothetical protein